MNKTITLLLIMTLISASSLTLFEVQLAYAAPTRLYFSASTAPSVSPSFGIWGYTTEAGRYALLSAKGGGESLVTGTQIGPSATTVTQLDRQYVSEPMSAGQIFTSGSTFLKAQLQCREFNPGDDTRSVLSVRIVSQDGTTSRATLLATANYGLASGEFVNSATLRNAAYANGDTVTASYTTVTGDRLVVELGFADVGTGATVEGQCRYGAPTGTDLPEDETTTTSTNVPWVEFSNTILFQTIPSAPTGLAATAVSTSQINLSWTAPFDGGSAITGYKIERESPVGGGWSTIVANTGSTSTTYSNTGLTDNTQYNYRVSAINGIGTGTASTPANATTQVLQTIPSQVTGLAATAVSTSQINLSWTAPSDGGSAITGYKIERESPVGGGWSTIVANTGSTSTTYSNTGLTDNTQYNYRVSAINAIGTGTASDPTDTYTLTVPIVPNPPLNLSSTFDGTNYTLSWNVPSSDGGTVITDYVVEYSQDASSWSTYDDGVGTATNATLTGLAGESYYFRVSAVNAVGMSLPSNQASIIAPVSTTATEGRNPPRILGLGVYKITVSPEITKDDGTKKETNRFENYFPYSINSYVTDQEMYGTHEKTGRFFKIDDLTLPTSLEISPNDLIQLQVQLLDEYRSSQIEHVALYFQDPGTVKKDTFIAFDKSESLQISDPNNIFDDVHVSTSLEEGYLWANFDIKFAKPTDSDVLIESWHESRRPVYEQIRNVLAESNPQEIIQRQTQVGFVSKVIVPDRIASSPNCKDDNACFDPYITNVLKEGIVIWENKDIAFTHTITSGSPESGPNNRFNGLVQPGESFYNVFAAAGQYQYYCVIHPWAQGIVNVVDEKVSVPIETLHVSGTNVVGEVRLPNKEQFPILVKSIISGKAEVINPNQNVISETKSLNVEISGFVGTENPTDNVELFIVRPNGVTVTYKVPVTERGHYFFPTLLSDKWLDGKYQVIIKYGGKQIGSLSFLVSDKKPGKGLGGILSTQQQLVIGELVDNMIYKGMHDQFLESGWTQVTFDDPQHTDLFMPNEEPLLQESKLEPKISQTLNIKFEYYYLLGIIPVIVWALLFKRKTVKA